MTPLVPMERRQLPGEAQKHDADMPDSNGHVQGSAAVQTDAAFESGVSGGRVKAKRSNPVLKVPFIDDIHNRGGYWLSLAIGDQSSKQLANSFPRNKNRKAIHNCSVR